MKSDLGFTHRRGDVPDQADRDGKIPDLACDQLREIGEQPVCLAVGFWRPHLPFLASSQYWDRYEQATLS